jgi:hypothetical protein
MRKFGIVLVILVAIALVAGFVSLQGLSPTEVSASEHSAKSAAALQTKIDTVKKAHENKDRAPSADRVEVSEAEMESYVLYSLREKIPAQLDSIDVQLGTETIAADTQLTFNSNSTGNPLVDTLIGGTHNLFVKGKLVGDQGAGKFDLEEIRVDGIPVPKVLIETLFNKYVKPKYPDADLKEPFELPWGIEQLKLEPTKATVVY